MQPPRMSIDMLHIEFPPGFGDRAGEIARMIGDELARLSWPASVTVSELNIPAMTVHPSWSDGRIAGDLARAVHEQICKGGGR